MNIHIDKKYFETLKKRTIVSVEFGSKLYGLNLKNSDKDFLHIVHKSEEELYSFVWSHHNYQFKEDGVDHVFTTLQNFISNLLKGDSTVNFECLFSEELENSELKWLGKFKENFNNYSLQRSYLGLARRDLKLFLKNNEYKKLYHGLRGFFFFEMLKNKNFNLKMNEINSSLLKNIRLEVLSLKEAISLCKESLQKVDTERTELSKRFDNNQIHRIMDFKSLKELDDELIKFYNKKENNILDEVYSSLNEDVKYEK